MSALDPITLAIVFAAGILSFFSPCVLSLVPAYLGYVSGGGAGPSQTWERLRILRNALGFILGFSAVFVVFGFGVGLAGEALLPLMPKVRLAASILLIVIGAYLVSPFKLSLLMRTFLAPLPGKKYATQPRKQNSFMAFLVGASFAFGWTPCVGPILGGILTLAIASQSALQSTVLLSCYAAGLAVPFLASALLLERAFRIFRFMRQYGAWIERFAGIMLITFGVLILTNNIVLLTTLIPQLPLPEPRA